MDDIDRKLLNLVQEGLPLKEKPFCKIAEKISLEPKEVISRLKRLKKEGYIRRLGGVFNSEKLGYNSTLVAAEVVEDDFYGVAEYISSFPGVTHCYRRSSFLNLWFTLTVKNKKEKQDILLKIKEFSSVKTLLELPREKSFKLQVYFDMEDD